MTLPQRGRVIMTEDLQALLYDCLKVQYFRCGRHPVSDIGGCAPGAFVEWLMSRCS